MWIGFTFTFRFSSYAYTTSIFWFDGFKYPLYLTFFVVALPVKLLFHLMYCPSQLLQRCTTPTGGPGFLGIFRCCSRCSAFRLLDMLSVAAPPEVHNVDAATVRSINPVPIQARKPVRLARFPGVGSSTKRRLWMVMHVEWKPLLSTQGRDGRHGRTGPNRLQ